MARGRVKWFSEEKGYGRIDEEEEDFLVDYTEVVGEGFQALEGGSEVEFGIVDALRGRKQATSVEVAC